MNHLHSTLAALVREHARTRGSEPAVTALDAVGGVRELSFAELDACADGLAAELSAAGLSGRPILIACPAGLEYSMALLGCHRAGCIAVPVYPPRGGLDRALQRVEQIAADSGAKVVITAGPEDVDRSFAASGRLQVIRVSSDSAAAGHRPQGVAPGDAPALLQYTSGTTTLPRGVLITHSQLRANLEMVWPGELEAADTFISWLPPYHDMGLLGGIFKPLHVGARAVILPPESFLRRPVRWLRAISH
jgi:acyl-CoA synthetase (AMP-forming)/AMP-acid ligase II